MWILKNKLLYLPQIKIYKVMEKDEKMLSLYDYLGRAAGTDLGKEVMDAARAYPKFIKVEIREVSNPSYTGKVMLYPQWFLEEYFSSVSS
jgi:hypothetical protein